MITRYAIRATHGHMTEPTAGRSLATRAQDVLVLDNARCRLEPA